MNNGFYDFSNDKQLLSTVQQFIKRDMKPAMENPAHTLELIIKKKVKIETTKENIKSEFFL